MAAIEISNIKHYTAESSTELPTAGIPEGSVAYVATTGSPVVVRTWRLVGGVWGREAVSETVA